MHKHYASILTCITKRCGEATKEAIRDDGTSRNLVRNIEEMRKINKIWYEEFHLAGWSGR